MTKKTANKNVWSKIDLAGINKGIKDVGKQSTTFKAKVQSIAYAIVCHSVKHNTLIEQANSLVDSLGDGIRGQSLVAFFIEYGFSVISDEKGKATSLGKITDFDAAREMIEAQTVPHWYNCNKAGSVMAAYDADAKALAFISQLEKRKAKDNEGDKFELSQGTMQRLLGLIDLKAIVVRQDQLNKADKPANEPVEAKVKKAAKAA